MYYPFEINEQVRIYDDKGRSNIKAKILTQPNETIQLYLVEYVGENEYGLSGQDYVVPSNIHKEKV